MSGRRGHGPKIRKAVEALEASGELPRHLRPVLRNRRILDWLDANGYGADLPSRSALTRHFDSGSCNVDKSVQTVSAELVGQS
jgi:hypothetical protein